jgi:predicted membrane protein
MGTWDCSRLLELDDPVSVGTAPHDHLMNVTSSVMLAFHGSSNLTTSSVRVLALAGRALALAAPGSGLGAKRTGPAPDLGDAT